MMDREKIEGKFVINLALDTNMLGGDPLGWPDLSRIRWESRGKRWKGRGGEIHEHTREELDEHTHAKTRYKPIDHAGGNRSNTIPRIGVGQDTLPRQTTGVRGLMRS